MWRDTMRGWRAFALVFFILVAVLTCAEVAGDVLGFFDLPTLAEMGGITAEQEFQRLVSGTILSTAITIAAAATVYAILKQTVWMVQAGTVTGIVLLLYMVYQVLSALFVLTVGNYAVIGAGSTYGMFGLLGIVLIRLAARGGK